MHILVPINKREDIDDLMEAGATEFYIGFHDEGWEKTFGDYVDINRLSGYKENANPYHLLTIMEIIQEVKAKGKIIYVTFNASIYAQEHYQFIEEYFERLKESGVDGVIVSCLELVDLAKKVGIPSVGSTICGIYNVDIARYYIEHGMKRIILPRDLSLLEIEEMKKQFPNVEYEVFLMRSGCMFSDSNCLGLHRKQECALCTSFDESEHKLGMVDDTFKKRHNLELTDTILREYFHANACGLCAIYKFIELGITAGKIVGRAADHDLICEEIRYASENIEIAKASKSVEEYLKNMTFPADRLTRCKEGLSCYYPEVRF